MFNEENVSDRPISDALEKVFLNVFTFLAALQLREVYLKTVKTVFGDEVSETLIFSYMFTLLVILTMVLLVFMFYY